LYVFFLGNYALITDEGEGTLPITLPPDPQNLKLVGWSHRIDNYYKPLSWLDVEIEEGIFYNKCRMEIFSISQTEGIVCSLNLNNGGFYAQVHKRNVQDLDWGEIIANANNNNSSGNNDDELLINGEKPADIKSAITALNEIVIPFKPGGESVSPDYSVEIAELMQFMHKIQSMQIQNPEDLKNFSKVMYYDGLLYSLRTSFLISSVSVFIYPDSSIGEIYINETGGVPFQTTPTLQKFRYTIVDDETNVQLYQGFYSAYAGFATEGGKKYRITVEDAYDSQDLEKY